MQVCIGINLRVLGKTAGTSGIKKFEGIEENILAVGTVQLAREQLQKSGEV